MPRKVQAYDDYDDGYGDYDDYDDYGDDDGYGDYDEYAVGAAKKGAKTQQTQQTKAKAPAAVKKAKAPSAKKPAAAAAPTTTTTTTTTTKSTGAAETLAPSPSASGNPKSTPESTSELVEVAANQQQQAEDANARALSECLRDLEAMEAAGSSTKPTIILVVLGHVDAGKSTLMGRLFAELGVIDSREVRRRAHQATQIGKGSFGWAWLMDERPEERERGVTIDIAKRSFQTERRQVTILDAPGHRDFVTNAISGISQADAAILVIDGSVGGFESGFEKRGKISGQTREHAQLAKGIGIEQLAVVVTKLDKSTEGETRFKEIRGKLEPFLKSCGYRNLTWLCASGTTGDNIVSKPPPESPMAWFDGPTVVEAIDAFDLVERSRQKSLRIPIFSVGSGGDAGKVQVTGRLASGCLREAAKVCVMYGNTETEVKSIVRNNEKSKFALAGDAVDLTLGLEEASLIEVGSVVCAPLDKIRVSERVKVKIITLELPTPFTLGQSLVLHVHAARAPAKITKMISLHDPKTGEVTKKRPRILKSFQTATIEISLLKKICIERYDDHPSLGRLVLRLEGQTVGVGKVTKVY